MSKKWNFRISDHVLLRYMERMLGVDVEDFRQRLHDQLEPAAMAGAAQSEVAGAVFRFQHNADESVVSTMWPSDSPRLRQGGRPSRQEGRDFNKSMARKRRGG
jgi:hypothetical protein